jgi:hypothetical protein
LNIRFKSLLIKIKDRLERKKRMPDATETKGTVDGVEPSILVRFVETPSLQDSTGRIQLQTNDEGTPRYIVKGGDPVWVTNKDLASIGGQVIEILEDRTSTPAPQTPPSQPQNPSQRILSISPDSSPVQG